MTRTRHNTLSLFVVVAFASAAFGAHADEPAQNRSGAQAQPGGGREGQREEMRTRVFDKIRVFVTDELAFRLKLDGDKQTKLGEAVRAHFARKQAGRAALRNEMQKLRSMVAQNASDGALKAQLARLTDATDKDASIGMFMKDAAAFLSAKEQADLALAVPEILKDVRGMMRDAKRGQGRGDGAGGQRGRLRDRFRGGAAAGDQ